MGHKQTNALISQAVEIPNGAAAEHVVSSTNSGFVFDAGEGWWRISFGVRY